MRFKSAMSMRERSSILSKLLHIVDCSTIVVLLWSLVWFFNVDWSDHYLHLMGGSFVLCFFTFYSFQLYRSWRGREYYREFIVILESWGSTVGFLLFFFFITKTSDRYSRSVVLTWFFLSPFLVFLAHCLVRLILREIRSRGINLKKAVIIGAGELGLQLASHIKNMPWTGIDIIGFFDDKGGNPAIDKLGVPCLGNIHLLPEYLKSNKIDYIYIALPLRAQTKIDYILSQCRIFGAELYLAPDFYIFGLFNARLEALGDIMLLNFNPDPRMKRYFDIVFSSLILVLTLPVTALISFLIKLEDGGPIFYGHKRIAAAGKSFRCFKFRTMFINADQRLEEILARDPSAMEEWDRSFKLKSDPRITKIGKFLRKTSLDELPQFINVLRGEMSVVGARPIVHAELYNYYKDNAGLYCSMKPGITGPWQVSMRSDTEDYDDRVQLDTWYVLNRSFWLDLKIIFKTVLCMFNRKGAY